MRVLSEQNGLLHHHLVHLSTFVLGVRWFGLPLLPFHQSSTAPQVDESST
ncbi:MAG: hypothetical protein IJ693_03615 [Bacteroidaceae bacterium]|nr:hypothetical protein [Bacteroidaceae bacterium]